jgi:hypothetical protein
MKTLGLLISLGAFLAACGGQIIFDEPDAGGGGTRGSTTTESSTGPTASAVVTSGPTGAGGASSTGGGGTGGVGDAGQSSIACPGGATATHAVDAWADALASTPTYLYWLDISGAVMRRSKTTGEIERLSGTANRGTHLRVDATHVFWEERSDDSTLYSMPLDGSGPATRIAVNVGAWALGGDRVYFWQRNQGGAPLGQIVWVPKTGGPAATIVANAPSSDPMAADPTGLYWYDLRGFEAGITGLLKFARATNNETRFTEATRVRYVLADGDRVIWADEQAYLGPADIRWSPPSGENAVTVARSQPAILGLAADAYDAYWLTGTPVGSTGPADLVTAPLAGGPAKKLACGIDMPLAITVSDDAVYVASARSVVWKIAKAPKFE